MRLPWGKNKDKGEKIEETLKDELILGLASQTNDDAEEFISTLESKFENVSDSEKARTLLKIGDVLYDHSYFIHSLKSWTNALIYYTKIKDIDTESVCYSNIGLAYKQLGEYQKALEYHEKALAIKKDIGDRNGEANCYANIGNVYKSLSQYQKAINV